MTREYIIANLREIHHNHGIIFTSDEDALSYYKDLVDLILALQAETEKRKDDEFRAAVEERIARAKEPLEGEDYPADDYIRGLKYVLALLPKETNT
jgi:hypothetical protein